ncbi:MAG: hypothetical protein JWO46_2259 [Nocardioidaceae bacterium]|nr:hypothetical protein [Nocardioidaceae bacterium]
MNRVIGVVLGLGAVVLLMFFPALGSGIADSSSSTETAAITNYDAKFVVDKDGTLHAKETLDVNFPLYKHGIFRFFDVKDPSDDKVRLVPSNIKVTRDGQSDGLSLTKEGKGRFIVARIGDASTTISGDHTYVITYDVKGVLGAGVKKKADSLFYWNLIPGGWLMPIAKSTLSATLPATPESAQCAIGVGSGDSCDATVSGKTLRVTTGALAPNTPVTVQSEIPLAHPGQKVLPWAIGLDPVLGRSVPGLLVWLVLAAIALVASWLLARSVREPPPAYPLMYAPPEGIGPAQGAYILTEKVGDDLYAATMLQLGQQGLATIEHPAEGTWTINGEKGDWKAVDDVTAQTAAALGVASGTSFTAQAGDVSGGKKMQTARNGFDGAVKAWARTAGLIEVKTGPVLGAMGVVGGALIAAFCFFFNPFNMSVIGLPFGVFAVVGLPLLGSGARTFRTKSGRDLWSRLGGFRRVLGTTSSEARFDFSGRKELYTAYIPWAVAFGVADVWAQKYRVEMQEEPPAPSYFVGGYVPTYGGGGMGNFASSFNSSVDSAISAYAATQSSSSSGGGGGGGFSGGGGGGGGGGGSW